MLGPSVPSRENSTYQGLYYEGRISNHAPLPHHDPTAEELLHPACATIARFSVFNHTSPDYVPVKSIIRERFPPISLGNKLTITASARRPSKTFQTRLPVTGSPYRLNS